jgi:hypothetical protein
MFGFLLRSPLQGPEKGGLSADAGHYLVLGFDKSTAQSPTTPATGGR